MAREPNNYPIRVQCLIPLALCVLHNFLRVHDPGRYEKELHPSMRDQPVGDPHGDVEPPAAQANQGAQAEGDRAATRRNTIVTAMWNQYQEELHLRHTRSTVL